MILLSFSRAEVAIDKDFSRRALLNYTYNYQFDILMKQLKETESPELVADLIFSNNTIFEKYQLIAPQIRMHDSSLADQYTTVVNLLEQLEEL